MNVTSLITVDYENNSNWTLGENKPNSNPILSAVGGLQMNVNLYVIEDYENEPPSGSKKTNPIQTQFLEKAWYHNIDAMDISLV